MKTPTRRAPHRVLAMAATLALTLLMTMDAAVASAPPIPGAYAHVTNWSWPVPPPWRVLHAFEGPQTPYSAGHRGVDLAAHPGAPVLAPANGVVYFAGTVAGRPVLTVQLAENLLVSVEPAETTFTKGQAVSRGAEIGTVGTGGHCDGGCLHLGVRLNGEYVSPLLYYGGVPRAVLLPLHWSPRR